MIKNEIKSNLDNILHANIFHPTVLPAMSSARKMWATTKKDEHNELGKDL